jgi:hypothetical protein
MLRRTQIYVGPIAVNELTERAIAAGYMDARAGTEHLYVNLEDKGDGWGILDALFDLEAKLTCKLGKAIALHVHSEG